MRADPRVAIEVDHADASDTWESVVADGTYVELTGQGRSRPGNSPDLSDSGPLPDLGGEHTVIFRIELSRKTGRYERPT